MSWVYLPLVTAGGAMMPIQAAGTLREFSVAYVNSVLPGDLQKSVRAIFKSIMGV
jgi:hypothetical protein